MRTIVVTGAVLKSVCGLTGAQDPDLESPRAAEPEAAVREVVASSAGRVTVVEGWSSREGRAVTVLRVGVDLAAGERRPALLLVAGIDARHRVGTRVALGVARQIAADHEALLRVADLYVVPRLNPDGAARWADGASRLDAGWNAPEVNPWKSDGDRDARIDEDGPADLNGDGLITRMRVRDPAPGTGLRPTDITDPDDPRLLRRAEASKGERPVYAVLTEGMDADGDGLVAEDGPEGVDLDRNFPYHWPEFEDRAGLTPLSEPETRGLAEWLLEHPEVVAVLVYTPRDTLVNAPGGTKMDATGQVPADGAVLDEDKGFIEHIAKRFTEATRHKEAPGGSSDGSLQGWAYGHLGLLSFSTPVWVRPDQMSASGEGDAEQDKDKSKGDEKKRLNGEEARWLAYADSLGEAGQGAFVPWTPFEHPRLGLVEIGGFLPGFRVDAPESETARLVGEQVRFVTEVLERLPRLEEPVASAERLGERVWRVTVRARNAGFLPSRSEMGVRTRRLAPTRLVLELDEARLVAGTRVQSAASLGGSGGSLTGEWTVTGSAGERVVVRLLSPEMGDREVVVELRDAGGGK